MTTAAELVVKVSADTAGAERDLRSFSSRLLGGGGMLGTAAGTFGGVLGAQLVGGAISGVRNLSGALIGLGSDAVSAGADFEASMDGISAVLGGTSQDAERLGQFIMDLGMNPNLKVSVDEAAQAVEILATQGVTLEGIMGGVTEGTVLLANATGGDFAASANVATDAMNLFGLGVADISTIVNGATGVINQSKFDINDYAYALANGGATASQFGVDLVDFNTVIAGTSNSFVRGQTAGTAFSTMLTRLVPASGPAGDAMAELGWITEDGANIFFDATGNLKDMNEIVGILSGSLGDLTDEQRINYATQIFGTQGMDSALALSKMTREEYDALKATIANTDAFESAKVRTDNLKSAWETLGDVWQGAKISFGQALEEPLQDVVRIVTPIIQLASPVIEQVGQSIGDWLAGIIEPIQARIPAAVELFYTLTTKSIYGTNVDPITAFRRSMSVALGTDTISLGPVNVNIESGKVTWGTDKTTFGDYVGDQLYAALQRTFSGKGTGPARLGREAGERTREWIDATIPPMLTQASASLGRWLSSESASWGEWLGLRAAEITGTAAPNAITLPPVRVIPGPIEVAKPPEVKDLLATEIAPPIIAEIAASEPIQSTVPIAVSSVTMEQVAEDLPRIIRAWAASQTHTMPPIDVVLPIVPQPIIEGPAPLFPTGFDFNAIAPIEITVPVEPTYVFSPSAQTVDAAIRDLSFIGGTGSVGGAIGAEVTIPAKAQVTAVDPGSFAHVYPTTAAVEDVEFGYFYNAGAYGSDAIIGGVNWGSYTHEYTVTAKVTYVDDGGLPGGGAAGGGGAKAEATGTIGSQGGWTLVGERGPEMVRLPFASRVWNARDTATMAGAGGPQVVIYAQVQSPADEESLARRIERRLKRGY